MGTESRRPSYLNHDAMKFPGVGDYVVDKSGFGRNGLTMGNKYESKPNGNPGPLDYSPQYKNIQNKASSPTTFGGAGRNIEPLGSGNTRNGNGGYGSGSGSGISPKGSGGGIIGSLKNAAQSILGGRSTTPGPG